MRSCLLNREYLPVNPTMFTSLCGQDEEIHCVLPGDRGYAGQPGLTGRSEQGPEGEPGLPGLPGVNGTAGARGDRGKTIIVATFALIC